MIVAELIYRIVTSLYFFVIRLVSPFNQKAKAWVKGRKNWEQNLQNATQHWQNCIWFHCASLGEFEQGRPLIEHIKKEKPHQKILLTFFSPSGYTIRNKYPLADYVAYLPADNPANAQQFMRISKPKLIVFVKYEWWYYFSKAINKNNIPFYSISCIFRKNQIFFKWYGALHRNILSNYTHLFVQDASSKKHLEMIGIRHATISGDTRFDRVWQNRRQTKPFDWLEAFKNNQPILIGASTYPTEDQMIIQLINENALVNFKYLIVPHDIDSAYCQQLKNSIQVPTQLYSTLNKSDNTNQWQVLIIDTVGLLNTCYTSANYAFVGGGFNKGIHNILEAAVFGLPVFFGPNYTKAQEAIDLVKQALAFAVRNAAQLKQLIQQFEGDASRKKEIRLNLNSYFKGKVGATEQIYEMIKELYI